jgi:predicted DNA binding CopG/RHH family protein
MKNFEDLKNKIQKNNSPAKAIIEDTVAVSNAWEKSPPVPKQKLENENAAHKKSEAQLTDVLKASERPRAQANYVNPKSERISLLVTPQIKFWIVQKATEQGISKNDFVNQALEKLMTQK